MAWLGCPPPQCSTGGKQKLGETGARANPAPTADHRCEPAHALGDAQRLDSGSMAGVPACPQAVHASYVTLANKMIRVVCASMPRGGIYRVLQQRRSSSTEDPKSARFTSENGTTVNESGSGKPDHGCVPRAREIEMDRLYEFPNGPAACDSCNEWPDTCQYRPCSVLLHQRSHSNMPMITT